MKIEPGIEGSVSVAEMVVVVVVVESVGTAVLMMVELLAATLATGVLAIGVPDIGVPAIGVPVTAVEPEDSVQAFVPLVTVEPRKNRVSVRCLKSLRCL